MKYHWRVNSSYDKLKLIRFSSLKFLYQGIELYLDTSSENHHEENSGM